MAGLGFKDFQVGEVLTSSDVDGYLMQQTVMRFADSAARGSALGTASGTAVALAEGMLSYLDDADRVELYDGTVWRPTGPILQVVSTTKTDTYTSTATSYTTVTGLTVSITPSYASSRVLLIASLVFTSPAADGVAAHLRFTGGNADDAIGDAASSRERALASLTNVGSTDNGSTYPTTVHYLDSPATTSPISYGVQLRGTSSLVNHYVGRSILDTNTSNYARVPSTLTAIEVAA